LINKQCYIVIEDDDLTTLIKQTRADKLVIGKDIGILSFNETQLKELLDISVISTDFELMGQTAADLILGSQYIHVKNPFNVIKRSSL
jgi:DNA-binding LacI/PurR family transcriptional regulator